MWVRVWVVGLWLAEGVRAAVGSGSILRRLMHDPRDMLMDQSERSKAFDDLMTISIGRDRFKIKISFHFSVLKMSFFVKVLSNICSNDIIFCTSLHLGFANNIDKGSFHFL